MSYHTEGRGQWCPRPSYTSSLDPRFIYTLHLPSVLIISSIRGLIAATHCISRASICLADSITYLRDSSGTSGCPDRTISCRCFGSSLRSVCTNIARVTVRPSTVHFPSGRTPTGRDVSVTLLAARVLPFPGPLRSAIRDSKRPVSGFQSNGRMVTAVWVIGGGITFCRHHRKPREAGFSCVAEGFLQYLTSTIVSGERSPLSSNTTARFRNHGVIDPARKVLPFAMISSDPSTIPPGYVRYTVSP